MHIGLNFGFGKLDPEVTDHDVYRSETELAVMAEPLGYDSVWAVEHHFSDYAFCPDNLLWLAHIPAAPLPSPQGGKTGNCAPPRRPRRGGALSFDA